MTIETTGNNLPDEYTDDVGLEDVEASDLVIPRIGIDHQKARFTNTLTGEEFETLSVVMLGMVKQRVFWDSTVEEGDRPYCKSTDYSHGYPNTNPDAKKPFPWDESNFNSNDYSPDPEHNNLVTLLCDSCNFKDWGKDKTPPRCNEQHTYPLMLVTKNDAGEDEFSPALLTLQRTGIKPSKLYISAFAQTKTPLFTVYTTVTLSQRSRLKVFYCVPQFTKHGPTNREDWPGFAASMRSIRDFLRQPPRNFFEEEFETETSNVNTDPSSAPADSRDKTYTPQPPKTESTSTTPVLDDNDDLPF